MASQLLHVERQLDKRGEACDHIFEPSVSNVGGEGKFTL